MRYYIIYLGTFLRVSSLWGPDFYLEKNESVSIWAWRFVWSHPTSIRKMFLLLSKELIVKEFMLTGTSQCMYLPMIVLCWWVVFSTGQTPGREHFGSEKSGPVWRSRSNLWFGWTGWWLVSLVDVTLVNRTRNFHNFSLETPHFFDELYLRLVNDEMPHSRPKYRIETPSGRAYWVLTPGR